MTNPGTAHGAGGRSLDPPLLRLSGLAAEAGGRVLVRGIDLDLRGGERVALVGPSGSGKTTILRAVAGLDDPAGGEVLLEGRAPDAVGWPAFRRRVVYVAQQPTLPGVPVAEVLSRPFRFRTASGPFDADRARNLLARCLLEDVWDQSARTLSTGQQQRVALVRALLLDPACLLLDEPTSGLDADARDAAEDLVREATAEIGAAAIVVTHDRAQSERLCDRVVDVEAWQEGGDVRG
ncbi:MAG: ABC transporter ATP-binding protein [Myxococcota bacterium]